MKRTLYSRFAAAGLLIVTMSMAARADDLPKGLMLNLDLRRIEDGLIPSKTLYPLYVPQGDLGTESDKRRTFLIFKKGQGLDIPHSTLLDPDGGVWIATIRVFARTDGIVMSQGNDESGYAIYIKDGLVHAAIRTGQSVILLKELPKNGITHYQNKWVTIDMSIKPDQVSLHLNRTRVATAPISEPLSGQNHYIHIGEHQTLPIALQNNTNALPSGFTGAISSLKILRQ